MTPAARVALYYAPQIDDPLFTAGAAWLGRDPETNAPRQQLDLPDIHAITADARHYGFHATLKPPMRLRDGTTGEDLVTEVRAVAAGIPAFDLPTLAVSDIHGFLALRETTPSPALQSLADACVAGIDTFRAPASPEELARRRRNGLPPVQDANLVRWGYQYVFATWFFHMTLTRRLTPEEQALWRPAAEAHFAPALAKPRRVTDIALFVQSAADAPFVIAERIKLDQKD